MPVADVIVPLGTAAIGALGGYVAAAKQAGRENARLREERDARRYEARTEAYQDLVDTSQALINWWLSCADGSDATAPDELLVAMRRHTSRVAVVGTRGALAAAEALTVAYHGGARVHELQSRHNELVMAIRRDVLHAEPVLGMHFWNGCRAAGCRLEFDGRLTGAPHLPAWGSQDDARHPVLRPARVDRRHVHPHGALGHVHRRHLHRALLDHRRRQAAEGRRGRAAGSGGPAHFSQARFAIG